MNMDNTPLKQAGSSVEDLKASLKQRSAVIEAANRLIDADDQLHAHAEQARDRNPLEVLMDSEFNAMGMALAHDLNEAIQRLREALGRG